MFKKIEPLSKDTHLDLRYDQVHGYDFAKNVLNAPVSASEFLQASRSYAIIFPKNEAAPLVLFTLAMQNNQYVNEDGSWKVPYVPAHIRRYPFILANVKAEENAGDENRFVFCIDSEAPHFSTGQGDPMFTANEDVTDIGKNALKFLEKFQNELNVTRNICQELEDKDILVNKQINFQQDGQTVPVDMFRVVDIEKMNKLDDETLARWVRSGLIGLINLHVQSLANLKSFG